MRRLDRIATIERGLLANAHAAQRRGMLIVCEAGDVDEDGEGVGPRVGCCVTHAVEYTGQPEPRLPFSRGDRRMLAEWDGIEAGFDGVPLRLARTGDDRRVDPDFWRMGKRLRKRLRPVRVCDVPAAIVRRRAERRAA